MSEIETNIISTVYFTKFSKLSHDKFVMENLYGNTIGSGNSEVPYIYCLNEKDLTSQSKKNMFRLQVTFCWPNGSKIFDETSTDKRETYEEYNRRGYVGIIRLFDNSKRYVFFDVRKYIIKIKDVITNEILFKKNNEEQSKEEHNDEDVYCCDELSEISIKENDVELAQNSIDKLLITQIGPDYIDTQKDYFNISEICRRRQLPAYVIEEKLQKIISRIEINTLSGCWVSTSKKDYKRCFWLALGGLRFNDIFHFPQDVSPGSEPIIIKNKAILHSPLCELVLRREHFYCCRPQHLKLGTSKENATHVKIRKSLDQIFDFSPTDMRKYAYHLYCLADLIQKQIFTLTRDEFDVLKKRKGNKILYVTDDENDEKYVEVIGDPDMGDNEIAEDIDDDIDMWKILKKSTNLLDKYTKHLQTKLL